MIPAFSLLENGPDWVSGASVDWLEFTLFHNVASKEEAAELEKRRLALMTFTPEQKKARAFMRKHRPELFQAEEEELRKMKEDLAAIQAWTLPEVFRLLGDFGAEPVELDRGNHGYRRQHVTRKGVHIYSDGGPGMGVHVSIPGGPSQQLEDIPEFCEMILNTGGKFTRVDLAIDDHENYLYLPRLYRKVKRGEIVTRTTEWRWMESGLTTNGACTGRTLYLGARESDKMCRIYDKRLAEIKALGKKRKEEIAKLPKYWNRAEMELHGPAAQKTAMLLAGGTYYIKNATEKQFFERRPVEELAPEVLNDFMTVKTRFKQDDTGKRRLVSDSNKRRWPVALFWESWLAGAGKTSVSRTVPKTNIDRRCQWLTSQCSKTLAMAMQVLTPEQMTEIFLHGKAAENYADKMEIFLFKKKALFDHLKMRKLKETGPFSQWPRLSKHKNPLPFAPEKPAKKERRKGKK